MDSIHVGARREAIKDWPATPRCRRGITDFEYKGRRSVGHGVTPANSSKSRSFHPGGQPGGSGRRPLLPRSSPFGVHTAIIFVESLSNLRFVWMSESASEPESLGNCTIPCCRNFRA